MLSISQINKLLEATIARLARGDGQGKLVDLGIQGTEAVKDGGVSKGVLYNDEVKARGNGSAVQGLVHEVMDHLLKEHLRLRSVALESYSTQAQSIADGAGRDTIASALLRELKLYGTVPPESDALTRARERVYYLAIALCDGSRSLTDDPILEDPKNPVPDLRFRQHLLEIHGHHHAAFVEVYREFLVVAEREPVRSPEHVARVVGTFIEGALVFRRIATCHENVSPAGGRDPADLMLGDDELVDAILRIFMAMSHPIGAEAPDPEVILFRRSGQSPSRSAPEATLHLETKGLLDSLVGLIDGLDEGEELAHSSLHSSAAVRAPQEMEAFGAAIERFCARGGCLRNIEKIGSIAELDATVVRLEEQCDAGQDIRYRALLLDVPPSHSPLLVGDRASFLTRQEDGAIVDAVAFADQPGQRWCRAHYEALWADERGFTLATPSGLNHHRITEARLQLKGLERQPEVGAEA
jgi:hypothetical protein